MLLQGFGANLGALLPLGVVFVVGISIALGATALVDGGELLDMLYGAMPAADADPDAAARQRAGNARQPRVQLAMLFGALCALPTLLALWWAPALVVFQDARARDRAAARACARRSPTGAPLLRYALGVFVVGAIVPTLITAAHRAARAAAGRRDAGRGAGAAVPGVLRRDAAHLRLRELPRRVPRRRDARAFRRRRRQRRDAPRLRRLRASRNRAPAT